MNRYLLSAVFAFALTTVAHFWLGMWEAFVMMGLIAVALSTGLVAWGLTWSRQFLVAGLALLPVVVSFAGRGIVIPDLLVKFSALVVVAAIAAALGTALTSSVPTRAPTSLKR